MYKHFVLNLFIVVTCKELLLLIQSYICSYIWETYWHITKYKPTFSIIAYLDISLLTYWEDWSWSYDKDWCLGL